MVKGYDFNELNLAIQETIENNPNYIGLSMLQENFLTYINFINCIKPRLPHSKIIIGNVEASHNPQYILNKYTNIDVALIGEGEISIVKLVNTLIKNQPLNECDGICYRIGSNINYNKPTSMICDLDLLDFPDRSFVDKKNTEFSVMGSRGCYGNCTYCEANYIHRLQKGLKVRERTVANIVDEIEYLVKNYNCQYISFIDSTFANSKEKPELRLIALYEEMKKRDIFVLFRFNIRTEQITDGFMQALLKLKEVGLDIVQSGLESGNVDDLKLYGKIAKVENNKKAVMELRKNKIQHFSGFINFNPYTTIEKLRANINFFQEVQFDNVTPDLLSTRLSLYSGAPITKKVIRDGLYYGNINEPITNGFAYHFQDVKIDAIYYLLTSLFKNLIIKTNYQFIFSIIKQYKMYCKADKYFLKIYSNVGFIEEINRLISNISLDIFESIIDHVDKNTITIEEIENKISEYNGQLKPLIHEIDVIQSILLKALIKKNKLITIR